MFNNGTSNAFKGVIPTGGHVDPISIPGPNELWKNAQKKEKKKHTSDKMNNNIPHFNPL